LWEKKRKQDWVLAFTQDLLNLDYNVLLLSSIFIFLCFGCLAIVVMLVIVGRDMGRGAGEDE
jgi:hypothetical protein